VADVFLNGKEKGVVFVFTIVVIMKAKVIMIILTIIVRYATRLILARLFVKNALKSKQALIRANKLFSKLLYLLRLLVWWLVFSLADYFLRNYEGAIEK